MDNVAQLGLNTIGIQSFSQALSLLSADGTIHAVITEKAIPLEIGGQETIAGMHLFNEIIRIRYEVNIFILTSETQPEENAAGGLCCGYFNRDEHDYEDMVRKVIHEIESRKNRAPFFEALVAYAKQIRDSWHTPGHAGGYSVRSSEYTKDFYQFFGPNIFHSDLSVSVPSLDSLLNPTGVIREAQELAAWAFGCRYTFGYSFSDSYGFDARLICWSHSRYRRFWTVTDNPVDKCNCQKTGPVYSMFDFLNNIFLYWPLYHSLYILNPS